jgi:hypothetical protein
MSRRQTNIGSEALRWSLESAEREFGTTRKTLERRLTEAEILPAEEDGLYSTCQIFIALSGDMKSERLKKIVAERENVQLKNSIMKRDWHPANECLQILTEVFTRMRQEIIASDVPEHTQLSLISHLRELEEVDWSMHVFRGV